MANLRKCLKKQSHTGKLMLLKSNSDLKTVADATAVITTCMPWAFHDALLLICQLFSCIKIS